MQAIVLAGGLGTRLRPLTFNRPKALVPLLNRPQVLHIFDRLPKAVDEAFVAVSYMPDRVRDFFRETELGVDVAEIGGEGTLGTGGAGKNAAGRIDDPFVVCNGDVIDSVDFPAFLKFHRKNKALASIALREVEDPSAFGVVAMEQGRITRFVEKPPAEKAPSHLINAGRYIFEPEVLDFIEPGRAVSMETEVFPRLAGEGLDGFPFCGELSGRGAPPRPITSPAPTPPPPLSRITRRPLRPRAPSPTIESSTVAPGPTVVSSPMIEPRTTAPASTWAPSMRVDRSTVAASTRHPDPRTTSGPIRPDRTQPSAISTAPSRRAFPTFAPGSIPAPSSARRNDAAVR